MQKVIDILDDSDKVEEDPEHLRKWTHRQHHNVDIEVLWR